MKDFIAEGGVTVTDEMLNAWGEAAERGDYPGESEGETFYMGVPPTDDQVASGVDVTVRDVPPGVLALINARASGLGVSVDEWIRRALVRELYSV